MTVIVYRDGVMAADSLMVAGGARVGMVTKIVRNVAGDLAGAAGSAGYARAFLKWFENGEFGDPPTAILSSESCDRGIIVRAGSRYFKGPNAGKFHVQIWEDRGPFQALVPFYAMGCGASEARGALVHGATALEAVRAAIEIDVNCGEPIVVLTHD